MKHKCILGVYSHSTSEHCNFSEPDDIDGLGFHFPLIWNNFCLECGKKITEELKKEQGF